MRVPIAAAGSLVRASSAVRHVAPVALDVDIALYELQLTAESLVASQLQTLTPWSALTLYAAGLLTSLTPCCLSLLPLTVAYFASDGEADAAPGGSVLPALAFTAGLASVLAGLGVAAASVGNVFGDAGGSETLRVAASLLAIVFGLNLLQVVPLQLGLGSLVVDPSSLKVPRAVRAYIFGASARRWWRRRARRPCSRRSSASSPLSDSHSSAARCSSHTPSDTPLLSAWRAC